LSGTSEIAVFPYCVSLAFTEDAGHTRLESEVIFGQLAVKVTKTTSDLFSVLHCHYHTTSA